MSNREIPLGELEHYPNPSTYLADALVEHGVEIAFGVSGGHIWMMVDEMSNAGIKMITVRHEQTGGYAAEAYSKVTRKPGVCFATVGPGVGNILSAIQQAHQSNSPVLFLGGGNSPETDYLPNIQPSYVRDLMRHISKYCARLTKPAMYKQNIARAFMAMQSYPKGVATLEFPIDALIAQIPPKGPGGMMGEHALYQPKWQGDETGKAPEPAGDPDKIEKAVKMIWESQKPLIFAGDGSHWADAGSAIVEFAELAKIPVVTRRIARGCFPENHDLYLDSRTGRAAISQSDIRLSLGMKIGMFDGWGMGWPPTIQVNEGWEHIWTYVDTSLSVVGNVRIVVGQMMDYIRKNNLKPPAGRDKWIEECRKAQQGGLEARHAKAEQYKNHAPVHYGYLAKKAWDVCEEVYGGMNRVIMDGYTISDFAPAFVRARYSGQVMDASEYAGVGHGVGMAIGAAFGDPEAKNHPVLALMGDAGMGIAGMDYETALIHKLPIVYLVTENRGWLTGMKYTVYGKNWDGMGEQDRAYGQEGMDNVRYDKIAEMFGGHGEHVATPDQIEPALKRAFKSAEEGIPSIVNVHMDPRVQNRQLTSPAYVASWNHLRWDRLAPRAKAARRVYMGGAFEFEKHNIPPMRLPDPWEPVADDEDFTIDEE